MHDPRIGRFLSIDPLAADYPANGVYNFSENRVVDGIELEGLEYYGANTPGGYFWSTVGTQPIHFGGKSFSWAQHSAVSANEYFLGLTDAFLKGLDPVEGTIALSELIYNKESNLSSEEKAVLVGIDLAMPDGGDVVKHSHYAATAMGAVLITAKKPSVWKRLSRKISGIISRKKMVTTIQKQVEIETKIYGLERNLDGLVDNYKENQALIKSLKKHLYFLKKDVKVYEEFDRIEVETKIDLLQKGKKEIHRKISKIQENKGNLIKELEELVQKENNLTPK